ANDKVRSRTLLRAGGVPVPKFVALDRGSKPRIDFDPPYIVKPSASAASAGVYADSLVKKRSAVGRLAARIWERFDQQAVCDEFIVGREIRVGAVDDKSGTPRLTGVAEWGFADGWGFKTEAIRMNPRVRTAQSVTRNRVKMRREMTRELERLIRESMRILGVIGYATMDVRVDAQEQIYVLELNSNPGLWAGGALWNRPTFEANIRRIVESALRLA
ncbi:MAG TPA: ATP-grasp domain-containing protein, partial [Thermoanaerobaculia bacterium]|nr:ATP-grasp domain-containing protein [Thermoanaerobaculia bacterium]